MTRQSENDISAKATAGSYKNIFKATFLFGFVQVFNILTRVIQNKVVAILLGAEGLGIIGLFHTSVNMLKTGAGLGISESVVRDISEAHAADNHARFSRTISATNKIVLFTALLGIIVTIVLAPLLSKWAFNNTSYTEWYIFLSIAVGFQIYSDGQLAILKGMRLLKSLAKATVLGSLSGTIGSIILYFIIGRDGIIPSFILVGLAAYAFSNYFVSKIDYKKIYLSFKTLLHETSNMVKMGIALMSVNFIVVIVDLVVSAYISHHGGLADVGYYQAGAMIITGYFSVIITSMRTDYYPRISAIHNDNQALTRELNQQSETGLILLYPCAIIFIFFSSTFINLLYDSSFEPTNQYTDYAFIGSLITVVSNCMALILLAKQAANIFLWSVSIQRLVYIGMYILCYNLWGLTGLGISYIIMMSIHLLVMITIMKLKYNIVLHSRTVKLLLLVLSTSVITLFIRRIPAPVTRYTLGGAMLLFSVLFCIYFSRKYWGLNIVRFIKNKLAR